MLNFFSCISLNFWYTRKKERGGGEGPHEEFHPQFSILRYMHIH